MTTGDFEPQPGQYGQPGPYGQPYGQPPYGQSGPTANRAAIPRHPAVRNPAGWACGSWPA